MVNFSNPYNIQPPRLFRYPMCCKRLYPQKTDATTRPVAQIYSTFCPNFIAVKLIFRGRKGEERRGEGGGREREERRGERKEEERENACDCNFCTERGK